MSQAEKMKVSPRKNNDDHFNNFFLITYLLHRLTMLPILYRNLVVVLFVVGKQTCYLNRCC